MFKRKKTDCQKRHNDIDYHDVNVKESTTSDDNVRSDSIAPPSVSSWTVIIGTLYHHRGVIWAIMSVLVATACSLCIKLLTGKVAATQILFFRGLAQVIFSLPHLVFYRISLRFPLKIVMLILSRALVGSLSAFLNYFAFQVIPVATAKALLYSSPLFTGIFARVCLGEHCSVAIAFFSFLTVIAVTLVVQPPFIFGGGDIGNLTGILCAIVGAVVMAGNTIILRFMQILRIDAHAIIFIYGFIAMFCSCAVTTALGEWTTPHCGIDRWFVIGLAVSGFLEQVTVTLALKTEPALVVSIIRTNDIFLAFVFDFLIFHIVPNAWTVVGAILVVGSAIGMTISANYELKKQMQVEKEEEEEASFENRDDHLSRI
ncbi:solute carrier family 35 member G1-like [Strongylocentrotus purpuratus]|uniref:EamA domain-containing protein n=1 Tax=Strongylocentrotus purpuratus TaxID=7668 RepID=A0A7M7N980_STRPU|nr:solute carrier family 35 member G1-like [Strongylocentrotus purpuratus]